MLVRYKLVDSDLVLDKVLPLYSGLAGSQLDLGTARLSEVQPGGVGPGGGSCPGTVTSDGSYSNACASGDYEYGSFYEKTSAGVLRFFTPYAGQTAGQLGWQARGGIVDVTP